MKYSVFFDPPREQITFPREPNQDVIKRGDDRQPKGSVALPP